MRKSFILLALVAYACVAVYSLTRIKNPALNNANAQFSFETPNQSKTFKLFTNNQEALMKFYREAFGTDWKAIDGGYQGQVFDATINVYQNKTQKRLRRLSLQVHTDELTDIASLVLDAGGNIKTKSGTNNKSYTVNDPDGNLIIISELAR